MTPEQAALLRAPFSDKEIGLLPKGNTQLQFVGHAGVTNRLLQIDPDWSWEPFAVDEHGLPAYQNGCLWIRLTICGVTRIGVGDGPDPKQRIGDAIRNAAMRFGVALDLWSRQELSTVDPNGGEGINVRTASDFRRKHPEAGEEVQAQASAQVTSSNTSAVVTPPAGSAPAAPPVPPDETAQQEADVQKLRTAALAIVADGFTGSRQDAIIALGKINLHAAKLHLQQHPVKRENGEEVTVAVFVDELLKRVSRAAA